MSQEQGGDPARPGGGAPPPEAPWSAPNVSLDTRPRWAPPGDPDGSPPDGTSTPRPGASPADRPRADGIPLRPLAVGDLLDGTFTTIRHNPRATIGLAALLVTVQQGLVVAAELATDGVPTFTGLADDTFSLRLSGGFGSLAGTLLSAVIGAVLTGMLVVVVTEDLLGRRATAGEVWRRVRARTGALLVASTTAGIVPYVGLAFLLAPGVILWGAWALTTPALILEGLGPFEALRRSWRLAWPDFPRVWGVRALSRLLALLMQLLVVVPFALVASLAAVALGADEGDRLPVLALLLLTLGSIAAGTLAAPFLAGVLALLYVDRRIRAEGLDLVLRRQAGAGPAAPAVIPDPPPPAPLAGGAP